MPRIRSLKYEYFINEDLAQTSLQARLLGLGLTTLADREGRLEDRPLRIKVLLFPYHDIDVNEAIDELQTAGFLRRYIVDGKGYIHIINFLKHQKPHPKEAVSVIPSPEKVRPSREKVRQSREKVSLETTQGKPSSVGNGLGDLCSSVKGDLGSMGNGYVDSVGTGASATKPPRDVKTFTIWTLGLAKLVDAGMEEQEGRSFIGGLCKQYGKPNVSEAITKTLAQEPADPKTYLVAVLQGRVSPAKTSKVDLNIAAAERVAAKYEQQRS